MLTRTTLRNNAFRLLLLIACAPQTGLVLAQNKNVNANSILKLNWSEGETGSSRFWYSKVLGECDEGLFLLKSNISLETNEDPSSFRTRKFALVFYDKNFAFKWEKQISVNDKEGSIEKFMIMNNSVWVLYSVYPKGTDAGQLKLQTIDSKSTVKETGIALLEWTKMKKGSRVKIDYAYSTDHSLLALSSTFNTEPSDGSPSNKVASNFVLLDSDSKPIHTQSLIQKTEVPDRFPDYMFLSNDSIIFYCNKETGVSDVGFSILKCNATTSEEQSAYVPSPNKFISDYAFMLDEKNKTLVCAGLFSNQSIESSAGTFYISLNLETLKEKVASTQPFNEEYLTNFVGEPKSADKSELLNIKLQSLVKKSDGGVLLLAESRYTTEFTYFDFFSKTYVTRTSFHYDNILVTSISSNGTMAWIKNISKKQESTEDAGYYSSFCPVVYKNNLHLIYDVFEGKLTRVVMHSLDQNGAARLVTITELSEDTATIPRAGKQTDSNIVVIPSFRKNKFVLLKAIL